MTPQTKALTMSGFVLFFWATAATAFKIALGGISFFELLLIASVTTLIISAAELSFSRKWGKAASVLYDKRLLTKYLLQGLLNPFLYYLVLLKAYSLLPAQIAQPLNYSWQIVLILMISLLFKQKLGLMRFVGVLVSFAGIIILSLNNGAAESGHLSILGILLALGSAFIWATYWISKINVKEDSSLSLFFNFLSGTIFLLLLTIFIPVKIPEFKYLFAGIYVGTFEMGVTFILWGRALSISTNPIAITQLTYLSPVLSLILIAVVLKEQVGIMTIAGFILIIGGIVIANLKKGSPQPDLVD